MDLGLILLGLMLRWWFDWVWVSCWDDDLTLIWKHFFNLILVYITILSIWLAAYRSPLLFKTGLPKPFASRDAFNCKINFTDPLNIIQLVKYYVKWAQEVFRPLQVLHTLLCYRLLSYKVFSEPTVNMYNNIFTVYFSPRAFYSWNFLIRSKLTLIIGLLFCKLLRLELNPFSSSNQSNRLIMQ